MPNRNPVHMSDVVRHPRPAFSSGGPQESCSGASDTWLFLWVQNGKHWHQERVPVSTSLTPWPPLTSFLFLCSSLYLACGLLLSTADLSSVPAPPELEIPGNTNLFCKADFYQGVKVNHGASPILSWSNWHSRLPRTPNWSLALASTGPYPQGLAIQVAKHIQSSGSQTRWAYSA